MAYAIDRNRVSQIGEYGYEPAGNQSDIVTPTFSSWIESARPASTTTATTRPRPSRFSPPAGFNMRPGGVREQRPGQKLAFTVINIGGYSDWVASMQVIQSELKAVGIQVTADNLSNNDFIDRLYNGNYQLAYDTQTGGPTPYYELRQWLYSANSAPIGKQAASTGSATATRPPTS